MKTALEVHWDSTDSSDVTKHTLLSPRSLLLEQPIKDTLSSGGGHVRVTSTSPVLVYVVIETCASTAANDRGDGSSSSSNSNSNAFDAVTSSDAAACDVNAFFLPAVEQYFRCSHDVSENACDTVCPSFWRSPDCALRTDAKRNSSSSSFNASRDDAEDTGLLATNTVAMSMPSASIGSGGDETQNNDAVRSNTLSTWHVQHFVFFNDNSTTATTTSASSSLSSLLLNTNHVNDVYNVTDACVVADNATYLPFRLDLASGTFLPAGSRLAKLYSACVPNISAQGGQGDGADNDCDGRVDEEVENMQDDDGDDRVDEDTSWDCRGSSKSSRLARSGKLLQTAGGESGPPAEPGPPWGFWDYEPVDSEMPLLAVIMSLSVAILAVLGVISSFLLMELMSRRRQIRNTKIRPFVS